MFRLIESNLRTGQLDIADTQGVSLGKVNYCLNALLDKGLIKVKNFRNSQDKSAYGYLPTPVGVAAKERLRVRLLKPKMGEYGRLKEKIKLFQQETIISTEEKTLPIRFH